MKTLVLGASEKPDRYSNKAIVSLLRHGFEAVPLGIREGTIEGLPVRIGMPELEGIDTVTVYLAPQRQAQYADYILSLKPRRVIFPPGAENPALQQSLSQAGIEVQEACPLVMLSAGMWQ